MTIRNNEDIKILPGDRSIRNSILLLSELSSSDMSVWRVNQRLVFEVSHKTGENGLPSFLW